MPGGMNAIEPVTRKSVTLPTALWEAVSDYRFEARIKTEAEAVRRLIEAGLAGKVAKSSRENKRG